MSKLYRRTSNQFECPFALGSHEHWQSRSESIDHSVNWIRCWPFPFPFTHVLPLTVLISTRNSNTISLLPFSWAHWLVNRFAFACCQIFLPNIAPIRESPVAPDFIHCSLLVSDGRLTRFDLYLFLVTDSDCLNKWDRFNPVPFPQMEKRRSFDSKQ